MDLNQPLKGACQFQNTHKVVDLGGQMLVGTTQQGWHHDPSPASAPSSVCPLQICHTQGCLDQRSPAFQNKGLETAGLDQGSKQNMVETTTLYLEILTISDRSSVSSMNLNMQPSSKAEIRKKVELEGGLRCGH